MTYLRHVGVLGMKWGRRKASAKGWLREAGKTSKNSLLHPILTDRANRESIAGEKRLGTRLRRGLVYQKTKDLRDVNARVEKMKIDKANSRKSKQPLQERIDKAYGIVRQNGKVKLISIDTIPKIAATAFAAKFVYNYASQTVGPRLAWTLGKVVSNSPLR